MKYDSLVSRNELFLSTATIAAHASIYETGFRQRDVKFLIELFSNWIEVALPGTVLEIQNTQVSRYLAVLAQEGYLRKITRKGPPLYRLTRVGLVELITRIVTRSYVSDRDSFFFLYYFIENYSSRVTELIEQEGSQFPSSLRIEIEALLDSQALLKREIDQAKKELQKLETRRDDAFKTSDFAQELLDQKIEFSELVERVEKLNPYELNSQRPLTELIQSIPEEYRSWELSIGNKRRAEQLWNSSCLILKSYVEALEALRG